MHRTTGLLVDGKTRLYATIGEPIEHVGSPGAMTEQLRNRGKNAIFLPMHIRVEAFEQTITGLKALANLDGFIVTLPYKQRAMAFADQLSARARRIGAINAMRRNRDGSWTGDMFDGVGLVRGLSAQAIHPAGLHVLLLGAGGAGSAIADALAEAGVRVLVIADIDRNKAEAVSRRVQGAYPACRVSAGPAEVKDCDMLVNATPAGMETTGSTPIPLDIIEPRLIVVDIVLSENGTSLLRHAQACGCRTVGGMAMIEGQIAEFLEFFDPA